MATHKVSISGKQIRDKHTHYEAHPFVGSEQVTVIIRGDTAEEFRARYQSQ